MAGAGRPVQQGGTVWQAGEYFCRPATKAIEDNGFFKAATGEDYISAERKNKDPFSFRPYARFLFSCNEIPRNYGDRSDGFYRRLIIIRFSHSVPKTKRDPNLLEKLAAERDGILMWALTGLHRLMEQNYQFTETEATQEELRRYKVESNSALLFVEECLCDFSRRRYRRGRKCLTGIGNIASGMAFVPCHRRALIEMSRA